MDFPSFSPQKMKMSGEKEEMIQYGKRTQWRHCWQQNIFCIVKYMQQEFNMNTLLINKLKSLRFINIKFKEVLRREIQGLKV